MCRRECAFAHCVRTCKPEPLLCGGEKVTGRRVEATTPTPTVYQISTWNSSICTVQILEFKYTVGMGRRIREESNVRTLFKIGGGRSYAVTLPVEVIRAFKWQDKQKLQLTIDEKRTRIVIEDWNR